MKIQTKIEDITPKRAEAILKKNVNQNRSLRRNLIGFYASEMKKGNWHMTGEAIQISNKGNLLNGQHRLNAIINADITVKMVVIYGIDEKHYKYMDCGAVRNYHDRIKLHLDPHINKIIVRISKYLVDKGKKVRKIPPTEIEKYYKKHKESLEWGGSVFLKKINQITRIPFMAACCEMAEIDVNKANEFVEQVKFGENLLRDSPTKRLREYMLMLSFGGGNKATNEIYHKTIFCALAFLNNEEVIKIQKAEWAGQIKPENKSTPNLQSLMRAHGPKKA